MIVVLWRAHSSFYPPWGIVPHKRFIKYLEQVNIVLSINIIALQFYTLPSFVLCLKHMYDKDEGIEHLHLPESVYEDDISSRVFSSTLTVIYLV